MVCTLLTRLGVLALSDPAMEKVKDEEPEEDIEPYVSPIGQIRPNRASCSSVHAGGENEIGHETARKGEYVPDELSRGTIRQISKRPYYPCRHESQEAPKQYPLGRIS